METESCRKPKTRLPASTKNAMLIAKYQNSET